MDSYHFKGEHTNCLNCHGTQELSQCTFPAQYIPKTKYIARGERRCDDASLEITLCAKCRDQLDGATTAGWDFWDMVDGLLG